MRYLGPETEILHQRYAHALIGVAEDANVLDEVSENLDFLTGLIREDKEFARILEHPEIDRDEKLKLLEAVSKKGRFCDEFNNFIKLLVKKNRLGLVHGIFLKYRDIYEERKDKLKIFIEAATSLGKEYINQLTEALSRKLKKEIIAVETINPSLMGGFNLRIGDLVYNLSVANRLKFIREELRS